MATPCPAQPPLPSSLQGSATQQRPRAPPSPTHLVASHSVRSVSCVHTNANRAALAAAMVRATASASDDTGRRSAVPAWRPPAPQHQGVGVREMWG